MKFTSEVSPGAKVTYTCPASPLSKFAKVATVLTALASQTETTVTFASAPAADAVVDIYYGKDIVVPSGIYTATGNGPAIPAPTTPDLTLFLNVTAASGITPNLEVKVQQFDQVSATWQDVPGAVFAAAVGAVQQTLTMFAGSTVTANVAVNRAITGIYRCVYTITGTTPSFTFSVGANA